MTRVNPDNENEAIYQTFFHGAYSNLKPYIFFQNISFHWTYSNLTLFSFGRKLLNHYFNYIYNRYF